MLKRSLSYLDLTRFDTCQQGSLLREFSWSYLRKCSSLSILREAPWFSRSLDDRVRMALRSWCNHQYQSGQGWIQRDRHWAGRWVQTINHRTRRMLAVGLPSRKVLYSLDWSKSQISWMAQFTMHVLQMTLLLPPRLLWPTMLGSHYDSEKRQRRQKKQSPMGCIPQNHASIPKLLLRQSSFLKWSFWPIS